jgi:hypothetical protein
VLTTDTASSHLNTLPHPASAARTGLSTIVHQVYFRINFRARLDGTSGGLGNSTVNGENAWTIPLPNVPNRLSVEKSSHSSKLSRTSRLDTTEDREADSLKMRYTQRERLLRHKRCVDLEQIVAQQMSMMSSGYSPVPSNTTHPVFQIPLRTLESYKSGIDPIHPLAHV